MERAVKLALVDPRHLEYKELEKSPERRVRADLGVEMRKILDEDDGVPDDVKIKLYRNALDRFLTVSNKVPDVAPPPINFATPDAEPKEKKKKKKRRRKTSPKMATPVRRLARMSMRGIKSPDWEAW